LGGRIDAQRSVASSGDGSGVLCRGQDAGRVTLPNGRPPFNFSRDPHPTETMRSCAQLWRAIAPAALLLALAATRRAEAQQAEAGAPLPGPAVGQAAPDFTLPGATRYGLLRTPVRLSDYRGQTVVLAFFYKARTKG
jgi:hypothetical protein